jgi:hypothetical protein
MAYEDDHTCMSYEEEDTLHAYHMRHQPAPGTRCQATRKPHEEEDACHMRRRMHAI